MLQSEVAVWLHRQAQRNRLATERVRAVAARSVRWCRVSGYHLPALQHAASLAASELQILVEQFAEGSRMSVGRNTRSR
jgi:hypothetical protein